MDEKDCNKSTGDKRRASELLPAESTGQDDATATLPPAPTTEAETSSSNSSGDEDDEDVADDDKDELYLPRASRRRNLLSSQSKVSDKQTMLVPNDQMSFKTLGDGITPSSDIVVADADKTKAAQAITHPSEDVEDITAKLQGGFKSLLTMMKITGTPGIQNKDCLVAFLEAKLSPGVTPAPMYADTPQKRLSGMLLYRPEIISCIDPGHWKDYLEKLKKFCNQPKILSMTYHQRLMRVVEIVYLPEELIAFARSDWEGLNEVMILCSMIAQVLGPEDEALDEAERDQWITEKKRDTAWVRKLMEIPAASRWADQ